MRYIYIFFFYINSIFNNFTKKNPPVYKSNQSNGILLTDDSTNVNQVKICKSLTTICKPSMNRIAKRFLQREIPRELGKFIIYSQTRAVKLTKGRERDKEKSKIINMWKMCFTYRKRTWECSGIKINTAKQWMYFSEKFVCFADKHKVSNMVCRKSVPT